MRFQGRMKTMASLLQILSVTLVLFSGCRETVRGPLSADQVLNSDVYLPVHYVAPDADPAYKELDLAYYYFDFLPELKLVTFFTTENAEGERVRVARMATYNMNGQLVNTNETKGFPPTPIVWAVRGGGTCKVIYSFENERITGDPYQSCLFWADQDLFSYKLYTVWPEAKAVDFVNSLVVLKEASEDIKPQKRDP